jgi:hypothetical protein
MKYAFLMPVGHSISGKLLPQLLNLQDYTKQIDGQILTIANRTHVDARNWLATGGGGFKNPTNLIDQAEWLVWIDSDQQFNLGQIKTLLDRPEKFVSGWYIKDTAGQRSPQAMVAQWDEEYFEKNGTMQFLHENELIGKKDPIEVSYVGFGFCKVHSSIFKQMEYPYFRQNLQQVAGYQDNSSEDVSFCLDAYKATGIKPLVIPQLKIGHLKEIII